jgi:hypothetical protein
MEPFTLRTFFLVRVTRILITLLCCYCQSSHEDIYSKFGLHAPHPPPPQASVAPPTWFLGGATLTSGEGGVGDPIQRTARTATLVLHIEIPVRTKHKSS